MIKLILIWIFIMISIYTFIRIFEEYYDKNLYIYDGDLYHYEHKSIKERVKSKGVHYLKNVETGSIIVVDNSVFKTEFKSYVK